VHRREVEPGHHALHHQSVDHRARERDERVGIAGRHRALLDPAADSLRHRAAVRLEDAVADVDQLRHPIAGARGDRLREEHDAPLAPVVELVDRAHLRVELLDRVLVLGDAREDEERLLAQQILERGLDDVAARREVIEERRPLDLEGIREPRDRHVETLALQYRDGAAGELSALLVLDGAGHYLTDRQISFPDDSSGAARASAHVRAQC
jgi:hypothetical protein